MCDRHNNYPTFKEAREYARREKKHWIKNMMKYEIPLKEKIIMVLMVPFMIVYMILLSIHLLIISRKGKKNRTW